ARLRGELLLQGREIERDMPLGWLHPGARWWFKGWLGERCAALADGIQTKAQTQVLFLGGEQDRQVVREIGAAMMTPCRSLAGRTRLQEAAAVLERATLMISNDNGPMHIAAAVGTRVVGLFGPSDPAIWGPCGVGP